MASDGNVTSNPSEGNGLLLSNALMLYMRAVMMLIIGTVSAMGIAANAVNVAVFSRQGFRESINVTLLGLAVSDMITLINLLSFNFLVWFEYTDESIFPHDFSYAYSWVWYAFAFNSSWIAVFISVERCLCVTLPMKVKDLITPKVAALVVLIMYATTLAFVFPSFLAVEISTELDPTTNQTVTKLINTENSEMLEFVTYCTMSFFQNGSFFCLLGSTIILTLTLKKKAAWRSQAMSGKSDASTASVKRDGQVVKMVILVSVIILVSNAPGLGLSITSLIIPDFNFGERYHHLLRLCWCFAMFNYAFNASVNIIVYYRMSSKYKSTLREILCRPKQKA